MSGKSQHVCKKAKHVGIKLRNHVWTYVHTYYSDVLLLNITYYMYMYVAFTCITDLIPDTHLHTCNTIRIRTLTSLGPSLGNHPREVRCHIVQHHPSTTRSTHLILWTVLGNQKPTLHKVADQALLVINAEVRPHRAIWGSVGRHLHEA